MAVRLVRPFWRWSALAAASTLFVGGCAGGPHKAEPPPRPSGFVYYRDATHPDRLVRIDWEGRPAGGLVLRGRFTASPDGSRLLLPGGQVVTAEGRMLRDVPADSVWADDSRHLCAILDAAGNPANRPLAGPNFNGLPPPASAYPPAFLYVLAPGEAPRQVASAPAYNGRGGPDVAACSLRSDIAVITTYSGAANRWVTQVTRLSDGVQQLGQPGYGGVRAVSPDGRLFARDDLSTSSTEIRRLPDGELVARLAHADVSGFSADGARLVLTDVPPVINSRNYARPVRVIEWQSGREIFSVVGYPGPVAARPGASDVAVHVCLDSRCSGEDVWLVGDQSTPRRIATNASPGR